MDVSDVLWMGSYLAAGAGIVEALAKCKEIKL
jgi:hypothetical protein